MTAKYKFADKDHKTVNNLVTGESGLYPGCHQWTDYQGWVDTGGVTEPYQTIEEAAIAQAAEEMAAANKAYEIESSTPVDVGGIWYKGGESSASTISGAVTLAQVLGETEVTLVDIDLNEHTMPIADALAVAAAVGVPARASYFKHVRAIKAAKIKKGGM